MKKLLAGIAAAAAALVLAPTGSHAQSSATIMLLHGIPGATVDVAVDGAVVIEGFEPGDMQDLSSFAGQTLKNLEVRAAGTTDVVIGPVASFDVPATGNWTVVAHLDADGTPTLTPFENNVDALAAGQGRLTVRHTAAAPAVDIVLGDARPFTGVENGTGGDADLAAGQIAGAQVAPAGGDPIADVPTVTLAAGSNLVVYAVGSLEENTFTFFTQTIQVGAAAPTAVNTGDAVGDGSSVAMLAAVAAGFALLAGGGALALRRRSR